MDRRDVASTACGRKPERKRMRLDCRDEKWRRNISENNLVILCNFNDIENVTFVV